MDTQRFERRATERYRLRTRVAIRNGSNREDIPRICFSRNISSKGVFIEFEEPGCMECGHLVHLEIDLIKLNDGENPVRFMTKGRVVRKDMAGLAVEFTGRANLVAK